MTDGNPFSTNWMNGWTEWQKQAMAAMSGPSGAGNMGTPNPWGWWSPPSAGAQPDFSQMFQSWWKNNSGIPHGAPEQAIHANLLAWGQAFPKLAEESMKAFQAMASGGTGAEAWQELLAKNIETAKGFLTNSFSSAPQAWQAWQGMMPQGMPQGMPQMGSFPDLSAFGLPPGMNEALMGHFKQYLSIISPDVMEKWRAHSEATGQHMWACQEAMGKFMQLQGQETVTALEMFQEKLVKLAQDEEPLSSFKEIFDLWVGCAEAAHAKMVVGTEYAAANAELVNAMNRLRAHNGEAMDQVLEAMNLPHRREMDSAHKTVRGLQRRVAALEAQLKAKAQERDLAQELNTLRDEVEKLDVAGLRNQVAHLQANVEASKTVAQAQAKAPTKPKAAAAAAAAAKKPRKSTRTTKSD
ncbi:MAG: hypothetical protein HQL52_02955 [Magnetococcales bacterium]|nr:hypothetical protein [Magnetococcales bacterium]